MNMEFCKLVGRMALYLERNPAGVERLKDFLDGGKDEIWTTQDVLDYTGWGRTYISRLCTSGRLPYITGNPYKFIPAIVKKTLEEMQTGSGYGRRKTKIKTTRKTQ